MGDFSKAFEIAKAAAAKERELEKRFEERERKLKQQLKELEREREQRDKINFLVEERKKLWQLVENQKIDKKTRIKYVRFIEILDKLIHDELGDTDDEDDYKGKVGKENSENNSDDDGNKTDDDPAVLEPESDENSLQYIKLKL